MSEERSWDDVKEGYAETIIDKMEEDIPDLRNLIMGRHIESPDDLLKGKVFGRDLIKYAAMSFEVLVALLTGKSK